MNLHESMDIHDFKKEKMRGFDLRRESRLSDPEHPELFRPTIGSFKEEHHSFDEDWQRNSRIKIEGVDDFDGDQFPHKSLGKNNHRRSSMDDIHDHEEAI